MRFDFFIARRISYRSQRSFSRVIIRIAVTAIVLSLAIMLISDSIYIGFQNEIKDKIIGFASHIQVGKTNSNYAFENEAVLFDSGFTKKVSALRNVRHIQAYGTKPGILKSVTDIEGVVLKGVSGDFDWNFIKAHLTQGRILHFPDSEASREIIVSKNIADRLNIKLNEKVIIYFAQQPPRIRKFTVCGIYNTGLEEVDKVFVLTDIRQVQKLNNWDGTKVGGYEIFIKNNALLDSTADDVSYLSDVSLEVRTITQRYPQLFDWLGLISKNLEVIIILMLIVSIINMSTALIIMILERTQMVGVFKSMGATNWVIQRIFLINAARIIAIGIFLGNVFGLGILFLQHITHFLTLSEENYGLAYVPVEFSFWRIIIINLGAFAICSIAMLLPCLFILRINPSKALRFE